MGNLKDFAPKSWALRGGYRGRVQGVHTPPPWDDLRFSNTTGILQKKKKPMWFIGVEVEQETTAPPPKKNPGSAPSSQLVTVSVIYYSLSNESNTIIFT